MRTSSPPCPAPGPCAPPGCSPRPRTAGHVSLTPDRWPAWPGSPPVTRQFGKHISIGFRWAVNRQLRDAVCDFAADSRHASPWATPECQPRRPGVTTEHGRGPRAAAGPEAVSAGAAAPAADPCRTAGALARKTGCRFVARAASARPDRTAGDPGSDGQGSRRTRCSSDSGARLRVVIEDLAATRLGARRVGAADRLAAGPRWPGYGKAARRLRASAPASAVAGR